MASPGSENGRPPGGRCRRSPGPAGIDGPFAPAGRTGAGLHTPAADGAAGGRPGVRPAGRCRRLRPAARRPAAAPAREPAPPVAGRFARDCSDRPPRRRRIRSGAGHPDRAGRPAARVAVVEGRRRTATRGVIRARRRGSVGRRSSRPGSPSSSIPTSTPSTTTSFRSRRAEPTTKTETGRPAAGPVRAVGPGCSRSSWRLSPARSAAAPATGWPATSTTRCTTATSSWPRPRPRPTGRRARWPTSRKRVGPAVVAISVHTSTSRRHRFGRRDRQERLHPDQQPRRVGRGHRQRRACR